MIEGEAPEENFGPSLLSAAAMMDSHSLSEAFIAVGDVPDTGQVPARSYRVAIIVWVGRVLSRLRHGR